jgi:hypothetical protein
MRICGVLRTHTHTPTPQPDVVQMDCHREYRRRHSTGTGVGHLVVVVATARGMFVVSEAEAAAIRTAYERGGESSATVELRRLFPGVTDTVQARECARTIAAWKPLPVKSRPVRLTTKGR